MVTGDSSNLDYPQRFVILASIRHLDNRYEDEALPLAYNQKNKNTKTIVPLRLIMIIMDLQKMEAHILYGSSDTYHYMFTQYSCLAQQTGHLIFQIVLSI